MGGLMEITAAHRPAGHNHVFNAFAMSCMLYESEEIVLAGWRHF